MGNFSRGSSNRRFGGRPSGFKGKSGGFGGRSSGGFRGRDSERPTQHFNATCDKCGQACQVPFRPTGTKPVLCAKCFRENGIPRSAPQPGVSSEQIGQINAKLDKILGILQELKIDEGDNEEDINEEEVSAMDTKDTARSRGPTE